MSRTICRNLIDHPLPGTQQEKAYSSAHTAPGALRLSSCFCTRFRVPFQPAARPFRAGDSGTELTWPGGTKWRSDRL